MVTYHAISADQQARRMVLAEGVKGIKCTYAGPVVGMDGRTVPDGEGNRFDLAAVIPSGCNIGSVEIYANGAVNAFVKRDGQTVGIVTWR